MLAIPSVTSVFATLAVCWSLIIVVHRPLVVAAATQADTTGERDRALRAFDDRVKAYVDLKKEAQGRMPETKTGDRGTGKALETQETMAARIKAARAGAKPGDVFGDAAPYVRRIIERDTKTRGVADAYAAMQEVPSQSPPAVNAIYPLKAALATVPPLILVNLPRLPDGLEYRFMGRDLILRDREANLIVDFMPGAVPVIKR